MIEQLLSKLEQLNQQEQFHWSKLGPELHAVQQIQSQKIMLKQMITDEQQRQEQERQKAQNEPSPSV